MIAANWQCHNSKATWEEPFYELDDQISPFDDQVRRSYLCCSHILQQHILIIVVF